MPDSEGNFKGISVPGLWNQIPEDEPCRDPRCTRIDGRCVGYHCAKCGEPCSSHGHPECPERADA